jgi:hypothetical protein
MTSVEQHVQRNLTDWFINANPIQLALIPTIKTETAAGAHKPTEDLARPQQTFRLVALSSERVPVETEDGKERLHNFVLVGKYDAEIQVGDHWMDEAGSRHEVITIEPKTPLDYETRAYIYKHGD